MASVKDHYDTHLAPTWVRDRLLSAGLTLTHDTLAAGLATFIARKTSA